VGFSSFSSAALLLCEKFISLKFIRIDARREKFFIHEKIGRA
jgi:hypothetical protein